MRCLKIRMALLMGIVLHLTTGSNGIDTPPESTHEMQPAPVPSQECWIFNHMNKAGGSTVKRLLKPYVAEQNITVGLYDSRQWQEGKGFAEEFLRTKYSLMWGGYTEGLRPYVRGDCKWFTVFRHPVPRLVSAYFYCKKMARDQLCASYILPAEGADLVSFAKHWSNYGLRQFALAFVMPEDMQAAGADSACPLQSAGQEKCPGWYRLKLYLEHLSAKEQASTPELNNMAMYNLIKPVEELLSQKYAAVGILEQWSTTTLLFNVALKLPEFDWPSAYEQIGTVRSNDDYHTEATEALKVAWTDPNIKQYLWLDLLVYDHAVSVHNRQVAEYGLV